MTLRRRALSLIRLESRALPSSTLYLDFGDNFPAGGFELTRGQLASNLSSGGISGPSLSYSDSTLLRFLPTSQLVTFDFNQSGGVTSQDWIDLRTNSLALIQRYYEPFDVNVVLAPTLNNASSATYFTGIRDTLNAGPAVTGERDCWAFAVYATVAGTGASIGGSGGFFGIASGRDIGGNNVNDDSCLSCTDIIFNGFSDHRSDTAMASTVSHEAAHNFALAHTTDVALSNSDQIVAGGGAGAPIRRTNYNFFTRYPLTLQGGGTANNGERYLNTNLLGPKAGFPQYISGTGENDIITVTRLTATTASVSVQAFSNATYTTPVTVPGTANTTFSYSVTFDPAIGLWIDAGYDNDRIVIDATLACPIAVRGMGSTDQLIVNGGGAVTALYTPNAVAPLGIDNNASYGGTLVVGGTTIAFSEFETASTVELNGVTTLTVRTPNPADVVTVDTVTGGRFRVSGTSGGSGMSTALIPIIADVTNLIVDTAFNDGKSAGNDIINVILAGVTASGRQVTIEAGNGTDLITIQSVAANQGVIVNAGAGNDTIRLDSNGASAGGTVDSILSIVNVNGQDGVDTLQAEDSSDTTNDVVTADSSKVGAVGDTYFGAGGGVTHSSLEAINLELTSASTGDVVNVTPSATITFTVDGNDPTTAGTGDRLNLELAGVTNPVNTPSSPIDGIWTFGNRQAVFYFSIEEQSSTGTMPPTVIVDDGTIQRSRVRQLKVVFSQIVGFVGSPEAAFSLLKISGGNPVGNVSFTATPAVIGGVTEVTISFTSDTQFGSLLDGRYRLTVIASQITGVSLSGNTVADFHRMYGDINGDARVDGFDFSGFSSTYGLTSANSSFLAVFDLNNDNVIDGFEFSQFSGRINTVLAP